MTTLEQLDRLFLLYINRPAGHDSLLDSVMFNIADSTILQGGVFIAFYWWLWFEDSSRRRDLVTGLMAGIVAVILSRALQVGLPFHARPLHAPDLPVHLPIGVSPGTLNTFSSFPSDHAVLFFALAVPLWQRSRALGMAVMLWTLLIICLPRVYLGYHWPSDVISGAVIGIVLMLALRPPISATGLPDRVLRFEAAHPAAFYAAFCLVTLELAVMFYDLRHFALDAVHAAKSLAV
jgi:undecaprenyl-diphosphatase